ncbi:MAG: hypothetical protein ACFFDB_00200 [Promethearchaeota archaeon]
MTVEIYDFSDSVAAIMEALQKRKNVSSKEALEEIDNSIITLINQTFGSMQLTYENKIREYEGVLRDYEEAVDINYDFKKGWDIDISRITVKLYIVRAREEAGRCQYCDTFKKQGWVKKLRDLWKELNILQHKYKFVIVYVDPVDRMFNNRTSPYYSNDLTEEGENFYISKSEFMRTYPSVELKVKFYGGEKAKRENLWSLVEGLGITKEGKISYSSIIEQIKLYLKDKDEKHLLNIVKHRSEEHYLDYIQDRKKAGKLTK